MDQVEDIERDRLGDRLGERNGKTQRVSDGETEKKVSAMLEGYDVGSSDRYDERSPIEITSGYRSTILSPIFHHPLPPHTMDISSVRFRPVPVMAQAEMTSTYRHPRLNFPELGKVNNMSFASSMCIHANMLMLYNIVSCYKCRLAKIPCYRKL